MSKKVKGACLLVVLLGVVWSRMVMTDMALCKQAQAPKYAIPVQVMDVDQYKGLGYTITIGYEGPVGKAGEQLVGKFEWGW